VVSSAVVCEVGLPGLAVVAPEPPSHGTAPPLPPPPCPLTMQKKGVGMLALTCRLLLTAPDTGLTWLSTSHTWVCQCEV
jgi:hypothetical protein